MPEGEKPTELNPINSIGQLVSTPGDSSAVPAKPKKRRDSLGTYLMHHPTAMLFATITLVLVGLLIAAGIILFLAGYPIFRPIATKTNVDTNTTTLSPEAIEQLSKSSTSLGASSQSLVVGATSQFLENVGVAKNLNVTGVTTVGDLKVNGQFTPNDMQIAGNLTVSGTTVLQRGVTIEDLLTVRGGLNVGGNTSIGGTLTAGSITARNTTLNGSLTLNGHLQTSGSVPSISAGGAVGSGGTVSVSGNDISGTVAINTGSGPIAGTLATITFRTPFASTPHVIISPIGSGAGALNYYVNRTTTGFSIVTLNAPGASLNFAFDYMVAQ